MLVAGEISPEEVSRNVDRLEKRIEQGFKDIRIDINTMFMRFVSLDRYEADFKALNARLSTQEDSSKWVSRTVIFLVAGAVISAIVGAAMIRAGLG